VRSSGNLKAMQFINYSMPIATGRVIHRHRKTDRGFPAGKTLLLEMQGRYDINDNVVLRLFLPFWERIEGN
jgi:hypothetical protein